MVPAADERHCKRGMLIVAAHGFTDRPLGKVAAVVDPCRKRDKHGSEPVVRRRDHELLRHRGDGGLPHESGIGCLQDADHRVPHGAVIAELLLHLLAHAHELGRCLLQCRSAALLLHHIKEVMAELFEIALDLLDLIRDIVHLPIDGADLSAQARDRALDAAQVYRYYIAHVHSTSDNVGSINS